MKKSEKKKIVVLKDPPQDHLPQFKPGQDPYQKVLYFAYGSNMHMPQLVERVGGVIRIGVFKLKNYKLTFDCSGASAYASIDESKGDTVEGVMYEMFYHQIRQLDRYEALYRREKIELTSTAFKGRKLHIYVPKYRDTEDFLMPMAKEYHETLLKGARENGLEDTVRILESIEEKNIQEKPRFMNPLEAMVNTWYGM